jgi:uncharacterized protein (TIGR03643 family)
MIGKLLLNVEEIDRIIEMAWEDRTPFDVIKVQFGIGEQGVIDIMRKTLKPSSFRLWRERVQGRASKHQKLSQSSGLRFKCSRQKHISFNSVSKRN